MCFSAFAVNNSLLSFFFLKQVKIAEIDSCIFVLNVAAMAKILINFFKKVSLYKF